MQYATTAAVIAAKAPEEWLAEILRYGPLKNS